MKLESSKFRPELTWLGGNASARFQPAPIWAVPSLDKRQIQMSHIHRFYKHIPPSLHSLPVTLSCCTALPPFNPCHRPLRTHHFVFSTSDRLVLTLSFSFIGPVCCHSTSALSPTFTASDRWRTITSRTSRRCRRSGTSPYGSESTPSKRQLQQGAGEIRRRDELQSCCRYKLCLKLLSL